MKFAFIQKGDQLFAPKKTKPMTIPVTDVQQQLDDDYRDQIEHFNCRLQDADDANRKSQVVIENLGQEIAALRKTIHDQEKIVTEHAENKTEGEWVSKIEFEKMENQLREKESLIQRLLTLKKEA